VRHEHPNFDFHERLGKRNAVKISDFMTNRQWQKTGIYNEVYRHLGEGTRHQLSSFVPNFTEPNIGIALCNWRRDFTERERLIMDLMIPHVGRAHINARKWTDLQQKKTLASGAPISSFGLTPRETEVLQWIVQGKTNLEIAMIIKASARTIDKHVERVLRKLNVENRASAIRIALEGV
jgi:DNA-binding CsgD family transcriptional regulator